MGGRAEKSGLRRRRRRRRQRGWKFAAIHRTVVVGEEARKRPRVALEIGLSLKTYTGLCQHANKSPSSVFGARTLASVYEHVWAKVPISCE